jgi:hypothetical protein
MCDVIVINCGEKIIETVQEFTDHFDFEIPQDENIDLNDCLCHVNIEEYFTQNGVNYYMDLGDYYVREPN